MECIFVRLHAAELQSIRAVACLTWQFPEGSMRYSCGPASSYAARRVDVPKGLHVNNCQDYMFTSPA